MVTATTIHGALRTDAAKKFTNVFTEFLQQERGEASLQRWMLGESVSMANVSAGRRHQVDKACHCGVEIDTTALLILPANA